MAYLAQITGIWHTLGGRLLVRKEGVEDTFSTHHGTLHGIVSSLDLENIEKAWRAAHQTPSGECELGHALKPSFVQGSTPICYSEERLSKVSHEISR